MANKPKKTAVDPRRARIDELRAQQKAAERKRSMVIIAICAVVGLAIVALAAIPLYNQWRDQNRAIADFGVSPEAANCGEITDDVATGNNDHVGPGTPTPDVLTIEYATSPPSSGQHFATTAGFQRSFYTRDDAPPVEMLVHNLEHGASIVWYDETVDGATVDELGALADRLVGDNPKLIVAPWDSERGDFPEGSIAISHWSTDAGHRQYCDALSGEVIASFLEQYPFTDSPEPAAG